MNHREAYSRPIQGPTDNLYYDVFHKSSNSKGIEYIKS